MKKIKSLFAFIAVLVYGAKIHGQDQKICVEVSADRYSIWQNETFEATVSVNGMEQADRLQIFVNGNSEPLSTANSLEIYMPGTELGEKKIKILVKVIRADTAYFMATRQIVYNVYYPAALFNTDEQNVMYTNFWNPLTIVVPGVSNDKVKMTVSSGAAKAVGPNKYIIKPIAGQSNVKLNVATQVADHYISLGAKTYKIKPLPAPDVKFDISRDTAGISSVSNFEVALPVGLDFIKWKVIYWDLSFYTNGTWKKYSGAGTMFSVEIQKKFLQLNKGDKILLENVKLQSEAYGERIELVGNTAMTW